MSDKPDFSPMAVDVVLRPEWAAKQGTDKNFYAYKGNVLSDYPVELGYTIPAGKTLYLVQCGFSIEAYALANKDHNHIGRFRLYNETTLSYELSFGGNGGGFAAFSKPFVYTGGVRFYIQALNMSDHNANLTVFANGYEI